MIDPIVINACLHVSIRKTFTLDILHLYKDNEIVAK
jgi:hypothetical protein